MPELSAPDPLLERAASALRTAFADGLVAAYAFGSHAEGRAHRESDLDIDVLLARGDRFEDYTQAVRNLARDPRFEPDLVRQLEPLPGFRNVLVHDYVGLDLDRVIDALDALAPLEAFYASVHSIASEPQKT